MNTKSLSIEVLYFSGCPSWKQTIEDLKFVLAEKKLEADIALVKVETNEDAIKHQFLGSPTIRVNSQDFFPVNLSDFALQCRVYQTPSGLKGTPSKEMLREQISLLINS
jgi:hypothetical protein